MKNKKALGFNMIMTVLYLLAMSAFYDKLSLWKWLVIAAILEVLTQVIGQLVFKNDDKNDDDKNDK